MRLFPAFAFFLGLGALGCDLVAAAPAFSESSVAEAVTRTLGERSREPGSLVFVAVAVARELPVFRDLIGTYAWQRTHRGPAKRYKCHDQLLYFSVSEWVTFGCAGDDGVFTCRTGDCLLEAEDPDEPGVFGEPVEVRADRKRQMTKGMRYRWRAKGSRLLSASSNFVGAYAWREVSTDPSR